MAATMYQDNIRFCYNARGSLEETLSHIVFCHEVGYIPAPLFKELAREEEEIARMVNGYIAYLKKSKQGANEPGAKHVFHEPQAPYLVEISDDTQNN